MFMLYNVTQSRCVVLFQRHFPLGWETAQIYNPKRELSRKKVAFFSWEIFRAHFLLYIPQRELVNFLQINAICVIYT